MSLEFHEYELGDLCNISSSKRIFAREYVDSGIPFYRGKEIIELFNNREVSTELFITTEKYESIKEKYGVPNKGDILLSSVGTLGIPYLVKDEKFYFKDGNLTWFKDFDSKLNNKYLYWWLQSIDAKYQINNKCIGSTQKALPIKTLEKFEINLPPLTTQHQIVDILENISNKIKLNISINKNLLSIADAIFKKEYQNFEEYQEEDLITSDFGLIPKDWCYKTLDEISEVAIGKTPPRKETWWFSEKEGVKWVSIKDLGNSGTYIFETSEYLTEEAIEKFNVKLIPEDTVILSFKLTVGRLGITTEEMVTNEAIAHFKLDGNSKISKEYLYLYLKNFNYEELGSTSSIAKAINSKIVKKIPVLIPSDEAIFEFRVLFENIFNEIKSNQLEINNLTKLRDTLLPKLMSGEIDVSKINCDFIIKFVKFLFISLFTVILFSIEVRI